MFIQICILETGRPFFPLGDRLGEADSFWWPSVNVCFYTVTNSAFFILLISCHSMSCCLPSCQAVCQPPNFPGMAFLGSPGSLAFLFATTTIRHESNTTWHTTTRSTISHPGWSLVGAAAALLWQGTCWKWHGRGASWVAGRPWVFAV